MSFYKIETKLYLCLQTAVISIHLILYINKEHQLKGKDTTIDLLIKVACLVKKHIMFALLKASHLNKLVQGGLPY